MNFKVEFNKNFAKKVREFKRKYPDTVDKVVLKTAVYAERKFQEASPNKTGTLQRSWERKKVKNSEYLISNKAQSKGRYYAPDLEYGTKDHGPKSAKYLVFPIIKGNTIVRWVRTKQVKGIKAVKMIRKNLNAIGTRMNRNLKSEIRKLWITKFAG